MTSIDRGEAWPGGVAAGRPQYACPAASRRCRLRPDTTESVNDGSGSGGPECGAEGGVGDDESVGRSGDQDAEIPERGHRSDRGS